MFCDYDFVCFLEFDEMECEESFFIWFGVRDELFMLYDEFVDDIK